MKKQITLALAVFAFAHSGWCLTADEIIANVQKKYAGMAGLSVAGRAVSDMDMSGVKASDVPRAGAQKSPELENAPQKRQTLTTTFTIRLARPNVYRIEWAQVVPQGQIANHGAVWSAGDENYLVMGENKKSKLDSQDLALASATGVSGGAAGTLPGIFFQSQMSLLKNMKNNTLLPEEKIGDDACYVVSGDVRGIKLVLWISKEFLVRQKRQILGSPMTLPQTSDAEIKKTLEQLNQSATPEAIEQMRKSMQMVQEMSSNLKGSLTETYEKIELNPPLN